MGNNEIREEGVSRILLSASTQYYGKDELKYILCYSLARDNRFLESAVYLNVMMIEHFIDLLKKEVESVFQNLLPDINTFENSFYGDLFPEVRLIAINLLSKIN
ncbi:MAG: hypothetical protein ACYDAO_05415 [Thermoplasmataceae archaeon]